jgi:hypothetical protein
VTLEPGAKVRDRRGCGRLGTVLGPGRLAGTVLVQWEGAPGANVVRAGWLRPEIKLCL